MVTSTSTPASMLTMICLTISVGAFRLFRLLAFFLLLTKPQPQKKHSLDEALVDAHLEAIPGLGTLTAGGLASGNGQVAAGQADGALDAQLLALRAVDELAADLLEGLDLAGGQGDADLVGWRERREMLASEFPSHFADLISSWAQKQAARRLDCRDNVLLGASPNSFSGLLYDILTVCF
jgi:hypothetical protein